LSIFVIRFL